MTTNVKNKLAWIILNCREGLGWHKMEAVKGCVRLDFDRNGLWLMTAIRWRSLVKRVLALLLFIALFGCLGSLETASGDQALLTLRQQAIMQYTRQGL